LLDTIGLLQQIVIFIDESPASYTIAFQGMIFSYISMRS